MNESQPITSRGKKVEVWFHQQRIKKELANECQILGRDDTSKFSSMSHRVSAVTHVIVAVP